jgi:hypothetical protein
MKTNHQIFTDFIDECASTATSTALKGMFQSIKNIFLNLFPPYQIEVGEYNHDLERADLASGFDFKVVNEHPLVKGFHAQINEITEHRYKAKLPPPNISIFMEMLEALPIHPRLKMTAAYGLSTKMKLIHQRFVERDAVQEVAQALKGAATDEEIHQRLTEIYRATKSRPTNPDASNAPDIRGEGDGSQSGNNPKQ